MIVKNKVFFGLWVIALILLPMYTSHHAKAQNKIQVTFWYTENESEAPGVEELIQEFEAQNPNIDIVAEQKGFFTVKNTYLVQFAAGLEPMVFRAARDWVVEFAFQGMIQPVDDYIKNDLNDFLPDALRLVKYFGPDGVEHYFGFPQLVDAPALFFNKHYFEQAGINVSEITPQTSWTWDEFLANAQKLYQNSDAEWAFTLQGMFYGGQPIYYGHGASFFRGDTVDRATITVDNETSRNALKFLKNVVDADWTPTWDKQGWETINDYFSQGRVAMIQQGPWELKNFLEFSPEFNPNLADAKPYASEDNFGIMRLPHDEQGHEGAPLGGHAYVISKRVTGEQREAAMKFAQFMSSAYAMKKGAIEYYHVPARLSVFDDPDVKASSAWKYIQVFREIVNRAFKVPVHHLWAQLEGYFADELSAYLADEQDLDTMLERVISLWKEILPPSTINPALNTDIETKEEPISVLAVLFGLFITPVVLNRKRK